MKKTTALIAAAPLALAMSACGTDDEPTKTKTVTETSSPKAETTDVPEEELSDADAEPEDYDDSDAQDVMVKFGEEYEWLDRSCYPGRTCGGQLPSTLPARTFRPFALWLCCLSLLSPSNRCFLHYLSNRSRPILN